MSINEEKMVDELYRLLEEIDHQMRVVVEFAEEQGVSPYELKNVDGSHPMSDLLLAKASALRAVLDYKMSVDDTVLHTEFGVLVEFPDEESRIIPCDRSLEGARKQRDKINWDSTDASAQIVYRQAGDWKAAKTEALTPVEDEVVDGIDYVTLTRENIPELAAISGRSEEELWHLYNTSQARNTVVAMLKTSLKDLWRNQ